MTLSLRSTFALLLSVLALACTAASGRGAGSAAAESVLATRLPAEREADPADRAEESPAPRFRHGASLLDGPPPRVGAPPPRAAAGTNPSHFLSFAARAADRRAAGAHTRRILTLSLARHLAAARDGTLSSRSNGVPPPVSA